MKKNNNEWRSFHMKLSETTTRDEYLRLDTLYKTLSRYYSELQQDPRFITCVLDNITEYKTNFVKAMNTSYGKPYLDWDCVNNPAKYYRIMMTQSREIMKNFAKKLALAEICEQYNWDVSRDNIKKIQDKAYDDLGYRPKYREIANLCQSKEIPSCPSPVKFELDYSSEDNQICEIKDASNNHVVYDLKVDNEDRVSVCVQVPSNIRDHVPHYARPNIIPVEDENGIIVDYEVMISYEPKVDRVPESGNVLGVDLGKLKAASMAALYADGRVSSEYLVTRETQNVLDKLNRVYDEVRATMEAIKECEDGDHLSVLEEQLCGQRRKLSGLRSSFARLVGRDVCSCAMELGCDEVHLEDLARLIAVGAQITGRWNFAAVRRCVVEACALRGVRVVLVDPAFTSKTSPFDNSEVVPGADRLVDCGCCVLDRDYLGALNIARCEKGRKVRSCGVLDFELNEEFLVLAPVRCKLISRKERFK